MARKSTLRLRLGLIVAAFLALGLALAFGTSSPAKTHTIAPAKPGPSPSSLATPSTGALAVPGTVAQATKVYCTAFNALTSYLRTSSSLTDEALVGYLGKAASTSPPALHTPWQNVLTIYSQLHNALAEKGFTFGESVGSSSNLTTAKQAQLTALVKAYSKSYTKLNVALNVVTKDAASRCGYKARSTS